MWVMATTGFFSVVAAPRAGFVMVRARKRKDLTDLLERFGTARQRASLKRTPPPADYRYRVTVKAETWAAWAERLALDAAGYSNFKDAVKKINASRARTYSSVWSVCTKIEDEERPPADFRDQFHLGVYLR
jgi:hypothetical protein